ncbi:hypothetical protein EVB39_095 [Rhizobium phage RHph_TM3_3_9]|nr:hypothetical protein EVB39_095 [Rhizobium phage RHph_TM3_3_9]QIG68616.1 hypothetical protein EVB66_095 [Rhizobium phage RHph_TM3_3_13]QIG74474.1 hypothetical protein EVC09_094 [Rhizobium phage RHph_TM3_3_10]QXV74588.1 hypothetical protein [Rhizobium phage RHEph19]
MAYRSEMAFLFPAAPKVKKPRKAPAIVIKVGKNVWVHGKAAVIVERDTRFANAWFVSIDGVRAPHSFSRDMITARD